MQIVELAGMSDRVTGAVALVVELGEGTLLEPSVPRNGEIGSGHGPSRLACGSATTSGVSISALRRSRLVEDSGNLDA